MILLKMKPNTIIKYCIYLGHTYTLTLLLSVKIIAFNSTICIKDDNLIFLIMTE